LIWASRIFPGAVEEIPATRLGGLDVHRKQLTFGHVDDDGLVGRERIATDPAEIAGLRGPNKCATTEPGEAVLVMPAAEPHRAVA
jgi:hypothetical protein